MRRPILFVTLLVLAFSCFTDANAEGTWDCPGCGRKNNTDNYCENCAHPAPWIESTAINSSEPTIASGTIIPSSINVGDIVRFGHYEQDGNKTNGAESIDWYILDYNTEGILLMSMYSLDVRAFHTSNTAVNWGNSSLREWLNKDFYNSAFSTDEQRHIVDSHVSPARDVHKEKILDQGNATTDKVFLLSRGEWYEDYRSVLWNEEYDSRTFETGMIPMCSPVTIQAAKNVGGHPYDGWWLRGEVYDKTSSYPYSNMSVDEGYCPVQAPLTSQKGIRPLIRVNSINCLSTNDVSLINSDFQYSIMDDNAVRIDKYFGNETVVTIPEMINGRKTTSIGINAFLNKANINSIVLPKSITVINAFAFKNCKNLTSITIPPNVTSINCCTFWGCTSLSEVYIPDGVKGIEYCAFQDCSSLESLAIPKTVTYIDTYAFAGNCPDKLLSELNRQGWRLRK